MAFVLLILYLLGRIAVPHRTNAGKFGSWSWTESNFHSDDVMDSTYTDPSYKPAYTLEGYSAKVIDTGKCAQYVVIVIRLTVKVSVIYGRNVARCAWFCKDETCICINLGVKIDLLNCVR